MMWPSHLLDRLDRHGGKRLHTKDLALLAGAEQGWLTTEGFLDKVSENLTKAMGATA
jgi:isocitrate dehydrogenase